MPGTRRTLRKCSVLTTYPVPVTNCSLLKVRTARSSADCRTGIDRQVRRTLPAPSMTSKWLWKTVASGLAPMSAIISSRKPG